MSRGRRIFEGAGDDEVLASVDPQDRRRPRREDRVAGAVAYGIVGSVGGDGDPEDTEALADAGADGRRVFADTTREYERIEAWQTGRIQRRHGEIFREILPERRPLSGAVEFLATLRESGIRHGIATSGRRPEIDGSIAALGIPSDVVVVERGDVLRAKPEPDLFLACQERLGVAIGDCYVVGDAVWDLLAARRAGMLSVGLLTGGYGEDELRAAGAFRVYRDPAELLESLDELGIAPGSG